MRRGFLNTPKAQTLYKSSEVIEESNDSDLEDSESVILDLHKAPASLVTNGKTRFIFREWPRNPEGPIVRATPRGKEASNGLPLWGA
jgi:hypothetical protein